MQKTITPIDNTLYIERNYDGAKIEETINNSMKAQNVWADLDVKERVEIFEIRCKVAGSIISIKG